MLNHKILILFLILRYILSLKYLLIKILVSYYICILLRNSFSLLTQVTAAIKKEFI